MDLNYLKKLFEEFMEKHVVDEEPRHEFEKDLEDGRVGITVPRLSKEIIRFNPNNGAQPTESDDPQN